MWYSPKVCLHIAARRAGRGWFRCGVDSCPVARVLSPALAPQAVSDSPLRIHIGGEALLPYVVGTAPHASMWSASPEMLCEVVPTRNASRSLRPEGLRPRSRSGPRLVVRADGLSRGKDLPPLTAQPQLDSDQGVRLVGVEVSHLGEGRSS